MRGALRTSAAALMATATLLTGAAHASGIDDGNAGLDALNKGSYDEAIRLFTRALKAGDLASSDQEFAYLNRGRAYLQKGQRTLATSDFRAAVRLAPSDADAQSALQDALNAGTAYGRAVAPTARSAWGPLAGMAGQTWMEVDGEPQQYITFKWDVPGQVLSFSGLDRHGQETTGAFQLNPANETITEQTTHSGQTVTAQMEVSDNAYVETIQTNGQYERVSYTQTGGSSFDVSIAVPKDNDWQVVKTTKLVLASPDLVAALGWKPVAAASAQGFWSQLGSALVQGAVAGVASGIQANGQ
jgi:tetratricopeptide (TPR) repeat protein